MRLPGQFAVTLAQLSRTPAARRLRRLAVGWTDASAAEYGSELVGLRELELRWLHSLDLTQLPLPELRVVRIEQGGHLTAQGWPRLHTLDLGSGQFVVEDLLALLHDPDRNLLRHLQGCLSVDRLTILRDGYESLPAARQGLRELVLIDQLSDRSLASLAGSALLAGLTTLEIPRSAWRPETLLRLADPANSPRLTWLDVRGPQIPSDVAAQLRQRFGAGFHAGTISPAEEGWF